jgi:Transposase DDE domain
MRILSGMFNLQEIIESAPLGDQRRNARLLEIVTGMVQGGEPRAEDAVHAPGEATPWAHTMGCFRFYSNDALSLPALYEPCRAALAELVPPGRRAYVIYDVSTVDYSHHATKHDRVQVGNERGRGYELFSALVVDETGRPLGPVAQEVRTADGCLSSEAWEPLPFVNHYEQVERGMRAADFHLPGRDLVSVMDREFDELALERWASETSKKWIIRAQHLDRKVLLWGRPTTLRNAVRAAPRSVAGTVEREGKSYELRLAETFVTFHGRSHRRAKRGSRPKKGAPLPLRVVIAELYRGGRRAHQWVLLTNLDEPADQIARIYTWRWRIERLFFLVKVGMRLETWGEQDGLRIARRLALCSLAAMAIYQLRAAAGDEGHAEVIRRIATLGGWLGRKRDPIGPIVLMRGMLRFLGTLALLDEFGLDGVWDMARSLSKMLGLPLPGISEPLRRPRRSSRPPPSARRVADV